MKKATIKIFLSLILIITISPFSQSSDTKNFHKLHLTEYINRLSEYSLRTFVIYIKEGSKISPNFSTDDSTEWIFEIVSIENDNTFRIKYSDPQLRIIKPKYNFMAPVDSTYYSRESLIIADDTVIVSYNDIGFQKQLSGEATGGEVRIVPYILYSIRIDTTYNLDDNTNIKKSASLY